MKNPNEQPYVSVIIPAYNQGPMLVSAIESVLTQSYPNVEIIVVNDGSPDAITRETAKAYEGRIHYIERENGGVAAARNTGIAAATGELIAWLDQDDRWLPHKLEAQVEALKNDPHVALVHSSYYYIDATGKRTGIVRLREGEWSLLPSLLIDTPISPCTVLFRRHLLETTGPFDPELAGADDWYWTLLLAVQGYRFYCIAEPLAEYRLHEDNTFRKMNVMVPAWLRMMDKFYALPNLPDVATRWCRRAYFQKHMAAAALYFGAGHSNEACIHLQRAAHYYPQGIATGRALQSLIYSKSENPSWDTTQETLQFVSTSLSNMNLSPYITRKLEAQKWLVRALHLGKAHPIQRVHYVSRALFTDPSMLLDRKLWAAGRRRLARFAARGK